MRLENKTAIITGAGDLDGIGAAIAQGYSREGAKVVIADIQDGSDVVSKLEENGGEAIFVKTNVTDREDCAALVGATIDEFGGVDVLVNNAAKFKGLTTSFMDISASEWNSVMEVNTGGPFNCIQAVCPVMMKNNRGKIINTASSTVFEGAPMSPHYVASKGAVIALTRSLARALGGAGINVNTLAPGFTQTSAGKMMQENVGVPIEEILLQMRSLKRTPTADDLVGTAIFLASDDSDFMTGQVLLCDGGVSFN
ncbi:MAG: glucose 1-dehydrogenase [Pseudomonadota bacterium]